MVNGRAYVRNYEYGSNDSPWSYHYASGECYGPELRGH